MLVVGTERNRGAFADPVQSLLAWATLMIALFPLSRMFSPGPWIAQAVVTSFAVFAAALLTRFATRRHAIALLGGLAGGLLALYLVHFPGTSLFTLVPSVTTGVRDGFAEIGAGIAPLAPSPALSFTLGIGFVMVSLAVDTFVMTANLPLLGGLTSLAFLTVPSVITPDISDAAPAVAAVAGTLLMMLRSGTRMRRIEHEPPARRRWVFAGVITIVAALVGATAAVPFATNSGSSAAVPGLGRAIMLDTTLDLGADLRRPREAELVWWSTSRGTPPYLRLATLTNFASDEWIADERPAMPLTDLTAPDLNPDIEQLERTASLRIGAFLSGMLPSPATLTSVTGLSDDWQARIDSRTIFSTQSSMAAQGETYSVTYLQAQPTLQQLRSTTAVIPQDMGDELLTMPENTPQIVTDLALEATAGAQTDYDKAVALQSWFRSNFEYSLDSPVEDGYDATTLEAMSAFLTERSGYCVHFATSFTLMARSLNIPTRIVLGLLPGEPTGKRVDGNAEYVATTSQLHTWPEIYFAGIGWIPFEPTASLGSPPSYRSGETTTASATPAPSSTPTSTTPRTAGANNEPTDSAASANPAKRAATWAVPLAVAAIILLALAVPFVARTMQRRKRNAAARLGDIPAAWREFCAVLVDAGYRIDPAESPGALATRIAQDDFVSDVDSRPFVAAIERASFSSANAEPSENLGQALDTLRTIERRLPLVVRLFPRSVLLPARMPRRTRTRADADARS